MIGDDGLEMLSEDECMRLLPTCPIGRVVVTIDALPAAFPVNFAVVDGSIVFKTGAGTKLAAASERTIVGFEVDSIDVWKHEGWSVMAVGPAERVSDREVLQALDTAPVAPWAGGDRHSWVRIRPELLSGRRISPRATDGHHNGDGPAPWGH